MTKQELKSKLNENHLQFTEYLSLLPESDFMYSPANKWTAGQQLQHIILSVKPVTQAFSLPRFVIKMMFGKSNRKGRSYDELVAKYKVKLQEGGKAPGRFVPQIVNYHQREEVIKTLNSLIGKMNKQIDKISDSHLDELILPHPLLGKLTLREMIYFTIYHVEHHLEITKRNLLLKA